MPKANPIAELLDRTPPSDPEAERAVLACMLVGKAITFQSVTKYLTPQDFAGYSERLMYETLLDLDKAGKPIDATLLAAALKDGGKYDKSWGEQGIADDVGRLCHLLPSVIHAKYYVERVQEMSRRRKLLEGAIKQIQEAYVGT